MRSPVQSFPVKLQDVYANARTSLPPPPRSRGWFMPVLSTLAAMAIGAGVGWYLTIAAPQLSGPEPGGRPSSSMVEPRVASFFTDASKQLERVGTSGGLYAEATARAWPIVLHRAGDGRFYADLTLDGHIVNILVDPATARSRLTAELLPPGAEPKHGDWLAKDVVLEHHRLPATLFPVSEDPTLEAVLGADLLRPNFEIDETFDRLQLVPRKSA